MHSVLLANIYSTTPLLSANTKWQETFGLIVTTQSALEYAIINFFLVHVLPSAPSIHHFPEFNQFQQQQARRPPTVFVEPASDDGVSGNLTSQCQILEVAYC